MKTKMFKVIQATVWVFGTVMLAACSSDVAECLPTEAESTEMHTMQMKFQASVTPFDAQKGTRAAEEWTWKDKSKVYIQFKVGDALVRGHAVYSKSGDSWNVSYTDSIGSIGTCEVYYFDGAEASGTSVKLNDEMAIYQDKNAVYTVSGSVVTLTAALVPYTSRLRFTGDKGVAMSVSGIMTYTGYDATQNTLIASTSPVIRIVDDSGQTPYIYGVFADAGTRELTIENSINDPIYYKSFGPNVLKVGESGYMTLPTEDTNKGWSPRAAKAEEEIILQNGDQTVSVKLKRVAFGTTLMGDYNMKNESGNPTYTDNCHRIYISGFYMGETEVTNALWNAVMGSKPKYQRNDGDEYPVANVSWEMITGSDGFLERLNALTRQNFRLPTEAEWEFAAKGGRKSKGYKFAGGNSEDNIWYSGNSGNTTHPVAQKTANELGLYDMSGNVAEWCQDYWYSYTPGIQYNPVVDERQNSDNHAVRGGSFYHNYDAGYVARRNSSSPQGTSFALGFRIAL